MATNNYPQNVTPLEVLYRAPAPFEYDVGPDMAAAIEAAIPESKVVDISAAAGYTFLVIRPAAGYMASTESALRKFAQMPGPIVVDVARTPDHVWLRVRPLEVHRD